MTDPDKTRLRRIEQYRDRWSSFGASTGIEDISERPSAADLQRFAVFADYKDVFLESIASDVSVAVWKPGSVLFEEGSYLDLAFFVAEGEVELFLAKQGEAARPLFDPERTRYVSRSEGSTEEAAAGADRSILDIQIDKQRGGDVTFLANLDLDLPTGGRVVLGPGEVFGEIGALSGWPQSVTARTVSRCTLVQIRVPALRLMRRRSKALKERLDAAYRERALAAQLRATPLFRTAGERGITELVRSVELVSCEPGNTVVAQGEPADSVYLVRSGFLKVAQRVGAAPMTVNYLSKGMLFGDVEFLVDGVDAWTATASSVEYAELVRIPHDRLRAVAGDDPALRAALWEGAMARLRETGRTRRDAAASELLDAAMPTGLVQGNSILVIDLERCTRCDDCVRACAATHDGRPRFVREGDKIENLLVTKACYHCRDPVCLVGCPTGAIRRAGVGDAVAIDDALCIGCGKCATSCPYDVIVMHETGVAWPDDAVPEGLRGRPQQIASKCDLCHTRPQGPACVHNCPNECAYRVGSLEEVRGLLPEDRA
jgi:Fe-S-cluster-containing dehydrogenase component